jgi:hypothetical protein
MDPPLFPPKIAGFGGRRRRGSARAGEGKSGKERRKELAGPSTLSLSRQPAWRDRAAP